MRSWLWAIPAVLGLAVMLHSYDRLVVGGDPSSPWASGFLCIGRTGQPGPWKWEPASRPVLLFARESVTQTLLKGRGRGETADKAVLEARLVPSSSSCRLKAMRSLADDS